MALGAPPVLSFLDGSDDEADQPQLAASDGGASLPQLWVSHLFSSEDALWAELVDAHEGSLNDVQALVLGQLGSIILVAGLFGALSLMGLIRSHDDHVRIDDGSHVAGRLQLAAGTLAVLLHFSSVLAAFSLDSLLRTCTSKSLLELA